MDSIVADIGNDDIKIGSEVLIFGNDERLNADTFFS